MHNCCQLDWTLTTVWVFNDLASELNGLVLT